MCTPVSTGVVIKGVWIEKLLISLVFGILVSQYPINTRTAYAGHTCWPVTFKLMDCISKALLPDWERPRNTKQGSKNLESAPTLWSNLPAPLRFSDSIVSFKHLQTYLFTLAFGWLKYSMACFLSFWFIYLSYLFYCVFYCIIFHSVFVLYSVEMFWPLFLPNCFNRLLNCTLWHFVCDMYKINKLKDFYQQQGVLIYAPLTTLWKWCNITSNWLSAGGHEDHQASRATVASPRPCIQPSK